MELKWAFSDTPKAGRTHEESIVQTKIDLADPWYPKKKFINNIA